MKLLKILDLDNGQLNRDAELVEELKRVTCATESYRLIVYTFRIRKKPIYIFLIS